MSKLKSAKDCNHERKGQKTKDNKSLHLFRFQFANFLIENNLPFSLSSRLGAFINNLAQNYDLRQLSSFSVDRKCISEIATNFLGPYFQEKYLEILKYTPFSLALDEGSLKDNTQYLAISAKHLESKASFFTTTKLISLIQLEGSKTGKTIFKLLELLLFTGEDGELRKKMFMGVCTDGATNMISTGNASLTSQLEEILPHMIYVYDFFSYIQSYSERLYQ